MLAAVRRRYRAKWWLMGYTLLDGPSSSSASTSSSLVSVLSLFQCLHFLLQFFFHVVNPVVYLCDKRAWVCEIFSDILTLSSVETCRCSVVVLYTVAMNCCCFDTHRAGHPLTGHTYLLSTTETKERWWSGSGEVADKSPALS